MPHAVLAVGVSPEWLKTAGSKGYDVVHMDSAMIAASIQRMREDIQQLNHTTFEQLSLNPGDDTEWDKYVALVQSRKWDAIALGGGVRTIPQLGDYFTLLVNRAVQDQPQAKLLFPLLPEELVPALKKQIPEVN